MSTMKTIATMLLVITFAANASAQIAKIAGIVIDPQPARITQAKVSVTGERDRREFTTDDEGFFEGDLQPGWYDITISHEGFQTRKLRLFLKPDEVTPLNVTLYLPNVKCQKGQIC